MKGLDDIIADFESASVTGEADIYTGKGAFVSDFNTEYTPRTFQQTDNKEKYFIVFDDKYNPIEFVVEQNRRHDLSAKISVMQDAINSLLLHDPRWIYAKYGKGVSKINDNLYRVEIERTKGIGPLPDIAKVIEFHVSDDEVLTKLRLATVAARKNNVTELASHEVVFRY